MRHFETILILALLTLVVCSSASAQKRHFYGDCSGYILNTYNDIDIHKLTASEYVSGQGSEPNATKLAIGGNTANLWIDGRAGASVKEFLGKLADQGYYTVNIAYYSTHGWTIIGHKNSVEEEQAAQPRKIQPPVIASSENTQANRRNQSGNRRSSAASSGEQEAAPQQLAKTYAEFTYAQEDGFGPTEVFVRNSSNSYAIVVTIKRECGSNSQMRQRESTTNYRLAPGEEQDLGKMNQTNYRYGCTYTILDAAYSR